MRLTLVASLLVVFTAAASPAARAQGFISPFIGYNFGGDTGCPSPTNCEDKRLNAGASIGARGGLLGIEEEFGYAKNFFGTAPDRSSSVLTLMTNLMIVPKIGPVAPYVLAGVGLLKTHVDFSASSLLTTDNNNVGWDVGGGLMVFASGHVGVRGDLRYFHAFQNLTVLGFTLSDPKLDFGRASAALVLTF
jgi:opacity protein-like surface antigen